MTQFLISVGVAAAIAVALLHRPGDRSVAAFAKTYDVPLTSGNVQELRSYIWWTRCWRVGGAITLFALADGIRNVRGERTEFGWTPLIAGYAFGALLGELFRRRQAAGVRALGSLERRGVGDYVSKWFLWLAATVVFGATLSATWLLLHPIQSGWFMYSPDELPVHPPWVARSQQWFVAALLGVIAVVVAASWIGVRRLAQSPVPAATPARQAVHHAIRTAAILSVAGGAVMAIGGIGARLGFEAVLIDGNEAKPVQWILGLSAISCALAATWGALLTLTAIPRFAPFAGRLPDVPLAD